MNVHPRRVPCQQLTLAKSQQAKFIAATHPQRLPARPLLRPAPTQRWTQTLFFSCSGVLFEQSEVGFEVCGEHGSSDGKLRVVWLAIRILERFLVFRILFVIVVHFLFQGSACCDLPRQQGKHHALEGRRLAHLASIVWING
jgi:hypothetical protein